MGPFSLRGGAAFPLFFCVGPLPPLFLCGWCCGLRPPLGGAVSWIGLWVSSASLPDFQAFFRLRYFLAYHLAFPMCAISFVSWALCFRKIGFGFPRTTAFSAEAVFFQICTVILSRFQMTGQGLDICHRVRIFHTRRGSYLVLRE